MSLKYRLILLTILVFAVTFGTGMLLGVHGARRLAESQLRSRLAGAAAALAGSSAPLNEEVLAGLAPLLDAEILVLDGKGGIVAHSGADWPWDRLRRAAVPASAARESLDAGGGTYYFGRAKGRLPATAEPVTVVLLADGSALREPTRTILHHYLLVLCVTPMLLSGGMYLVGLGLVRRIKRLNRTVDSTLSEGPAGCERSGDELHRLSGAFGDLLGRLQRSRERLAAQQRLATTGKIASSVAHEVRNPLQAIRLTVQMLAQKCPEDSRRSCELVLGELDRLSLLTDELLVLAGKDTRRIERVDISGQLRETLRLLRPQLERRQIRAEVDLRPLPAVSMDRNRCHQLLLNLLLNAVEASPRGATVRLAGQARGGGVVIRIADDGPGFPTEVLAGRAEEFFSTKTSGAGLGLSICRRIVAEARGRLELRNADTGAVVEVSLPAADGPEGPPGSEASNSPPPAGRTG